MLLARSRHTATVLPDGRVLVAGGLDSLDAESASVELYNPDWGTWQVAASMSTPRSRHTATLLLDGRVLVAGGRGSDGLSLAAVEIYDPESGTWAPSGSMATARDIQSATLLEDGRVLVAGGQNTGQPGRPAILNDAEVYDPRTDGWSTVDHLANARYGHEAVRLTDGRVLVAGGGSTGGDCVPLQTAETFNPVTGHWDNTHPMPTARSFYFAALLPEGVLVAGGTTFPATCDVTANTELYASKPGQWRSTGVMSLPRGQLVRGAVLHDGRVLVVGGWIRTGAGLVKTETTDLYNPITRTWSLAGSMANVRTGHTATLLWDGRVLVTGGRDLTSTLETAEVFAP